MVAHISDDGIMREESVAEHTRKTEYLCRIKGKRCGISHIMSLCGIVHDMGKNKQSFDNYIHFEDSKRQQMRGTVAHASTGAKFIYDKYHDSTDSNAKLLAELVAYAVAAHHGIFDIVDVEKTDVFSNKIKNVADYDEARQNAEQDYLGDYEVNEIFRKASDEFQSIRLRISKLLKETKIPDKSALRDYQFFLLSCFQRLVLSILTDADWEATSDFMDDRDTLSKTVEIDTADVFRKARQNFESYMTAKQTSIIQSIDAGKLTEKEKDIINARNELQEQCKEFAIHPAGIYCLPIPTGGGKTLSSLAYALEYCKEHPQTERIIYISPYISITEQNAEVFRQAIGNDDWIAEHHSSVIRDEGKEDEDDGISRFPGLDIDWEEPFICTTFVQFMNVLFSDRKQSLRLMHRLMNAVVIIDEVQSMPIKCVNSFNYMINFLNAVCNTDIVLCTATQPALEEAGCPIHYSTPKYMIENARNWFEKFERVTVQIPQKGKKYSFESLKDEILEQTQKFKSILIVLNTKSSVRKLYDLLKGQAVNVEYLTTNLCAEHRSDKIRAMKEILKQGKEGLVVVSTNLIEAGVDISFECVYRSMTGLDSLTQSAGRCNRNGEISKGVVYLIELDGENIGNMDELIQSSGVTRQVLYHYLSEDTKESILLPKWMDEYYKLLYQKGETKDKMNFPLRDISSNILQLLSVGFSRKNKVNIMNQAYKTAGKAYQVIDDSSFGIIVPYKKGEEIIESIQGASNFMEIKKYIRKSQRYTVNVRGSQLKKLEGLIQPVTEKIPNFYMTASMGVYHDDCGITEEWEPLIF